MNCVITNKTNYQKTSKYDNTKKTCKQHNIFDRMRRVLCDDDSIILKKLFRNIVIHENLQVIGEKQRKN